MSTVYNTEPPTKGKVSLKTTIGDLDIELWPKEAPKAVRNFVQLCLEGYYEGCAFHRVIKDFMAQTGDPTNTGDTSDSIYGAPFKDEFHSRLRFSHRGLVACANRNQPHTNGSQFFITLDKCDWLDKKNTIFGKIVGDTVYNMLRLNELEVDEETDRPTDPPIITGVEVLWNPFEDIVPRTTAAERRAQQQFMKASEVRKSRKGQKRNLALLSFGEDAEQEEAVAAAPAKIKSAHEVLRGVDASLLPPEETPEDVLRDREARAAAVSAVQDKLRAAGGKRARDADDSDDGSSSSDEDGAGRKAARKGASGAAAMIAERVRAAADKASSARAAREAAAAAGDAGRGRSRSRSRSRGRRSPGGGSSSRSHSRSRSRDRRGSRGGAAAAAAKPASKEDELYQMKEKQGPGRVRVSDAVADGELLKAFELSRQKYKTRKQQVGNRQKDTMARLAAFTSKLRTSQQQQQKQQEETQEEQQQAAAAADDEAKQQQESKSPADSSNAAAAAAAADEAYDGKVREDIDHRSYMPAAWRVDAYLNEEGEGQGEDDLASLRQHKLEFSRAPGDAMDRSDNLDDYVVFDPLLESAKGKFSRAAQREKKKTTNWAGKGQG
ncbi:hypothetical protein OEZ85_002925 [Tetradesmus obliquus]|uniref:PPIase cyclophilin-type domain-containing protein n=1 Tax=Tetradesmus obliquus TaxID=3088 RepID=A0ABY8TZ12_TETOB|nr:hypothetical protein OEZ85_002925 [Tetradesmus obliquus]